jgi:hypothetical protein
MRLLAPFPIAVVVLMLSMSPASAAETFRDVPVTVTAHPQVEIAGKAATLSGVAIACFDFTNREDKTLRRIGVRVDLLDAAGNVLASKSFDRRGTFAPHVTIAGSTGSGGGMRLTKAGQCLFLLGREMTFPSAALQSVRIAPSGLEYADGALFDFG